MTRCLRRLRGPMRAKRWKPPKISTNDR